MKLSRLAGPVVALTGLFLSLALAGCASKSTPIVYYSLVPMASQDSGVQALPALDIAVGVGPVTVPDYLMKAQIATRQGNSYRYNDSNRWAGMLEKDLANAFGNNLSLFLGTDKIAFFPWMHYFKPDYRVAVDVVQFDGELNGGAILIARWVITDASAEKVLSRGKSVYREVLVNADYEGLVDAEQLLLKSFSLEIAGELRRLAAEN